jgi:hypothetical protein
LASSSTSWTRRDRAGKRRPGEQVGRAGPANARLVSYTVRLTRAEERRPRAPVPPSWSATLHETLATSPCQSSPSWRGAPVSPPPSNPPSPAPTRGRSRCCGDCLFHSASGPSRASRSWMRAMFRSWHSAIRVRTMTTEVIVRSGIHARRVIPSLVREPTVAQAEARAFLSRCCTVGVDAGRTGTERTGGVAAEHILRAVPSRRCDPAAAQRSKSVDLHHGARRDGCLNARAGKPRQ